MQSKRLGKYLLLEQFAMGGMAKLYRAKITGIQGFEKLIAIKTILPYFAKEKDVVDSFIDEAKLAALLNHQNVVQIYDFGSMDNSYYIAMEYLFGKDLRNIITKVKEKGIHIPLGDILFIVSRICSGLEYAHNLKDFQGQPLNIIHRDISPQNVIITYEGDIKIVDFGIAKAAIQSSVTQYGMIKGKISYMSPEQAQGETIDHRSDIFSTGILLYELLTEQPMFYGDSAMQILAKVQKAQYQPIEEHLSDLPEKLSRVLKLALENDPAERYQSAREMQADIEECLVELSLRTSSKGLSEFMKSLFEEEIETEYKKLWVFPNGDVGDVEDPEESFLRDMEAEDENVVTKEASDGEDSGKSVPVLKVRRIKSFKGKAFSWDGNVVEKFKNKKDSFLKSALEKFRQIYFVMRRYFDDSILWLKNRSPIFYENIKKNQVSLVTGIVVVFLVLLVVVFWPGEKEESVKEGLVKQEFVKQEPVNEESGKTDEEVQAQSDTESAEVNPRIEELLKQADLVMEIEAEKARDLLIEAVELDPEYAQIYSKLGRAYLNLKDYNKAIEIYKKAAELDSKSPVIYFNLGWIYVELKEFSNAEEMYNRVVDMSPEYLEDALINLAIVQEKQGKIDLSIENLKKASMVNPENKKVLTRLDKLMERKQNQQKTGERNE